MNISHQTLYFIDFDGTLFKRATFWTDVRHACGASFAITEERFLETYQESKDPRTGYNIDKHLSLLGTSQADILSIFDALFEKKSYIFPDVAEFFENHTNDTVVILTQGVAWLQHKKITSMASIGNTIRVIVTSGKKREYIEKNVGFYETGLLWEGNHYESLTFIDNMADAFLPEDHGPIFRQYRMLRGVDEDAYAHEPTKKYSTEVTSLLDIQ